MKDLIDEAIAAQTGPVNCIVLSIEAFNQMNDEGEIETRQVAKFGNINLGEWKYYDNVIVLVDPVTTSPIRIPPA